MAAIAITAILLALAVPNFTDFIQNRRITSAVNELYESIQMARSEAIKRGTTVVMCRTGDPNDLADTSDEDPVCGANLYPSGDANAAKEWGVGWLVYALPVGNEAAGSYVKGTDTLLAVGLGSGVDITSDADAQTFLAFFGDGSLNSASPTRFAVCDQRGSAHGRMITVPTRGRPHIEDATTCAPT